VCTPDPCTLLQFGTRHFYVLGRHSLAKVKYIVLYNRHMLFCTAGIYCRLQSF
jgi:hypothetical protein